MKQTIISALQIAGEELLKHFGKPMEFETKESQSNIVTVADMNSDALIVGMIKERFPSHNILSEESGFSNMHSIYTWVIDPLDGTSNFAAGLPWFGILIALFENNTPIMAGAYLPIMDLLYFAERDNGTLKNGQPFVMVQNKGLKNSLFSFSVDYIEDEIILNQSIAIFKNLIKATRNIRSTNSLVDFLYVAEGKLGGCVNLFTKIWDISALGLIISEAGGVMKDIDGRDIQYVLNEKTIEQNFAVIAGSELILKELNNLVL